MKKINSNAEIENFLNEWSLGQDEHRIIGGKMMGNIVVLTHGRFNDRSTARFLIFDDCFVHGNGVGGPSGRWINEKSPLQNIYLFNNVIEFLAWALEELA